MNTISELQQRIQRLSDEQLSRRTLMRRAGLLGISVAGVTTLLTACGGDDDPTAAPAATGTTAGAPDPTATTGADAPTATVEQVAGEPKPGGTLRYGSRGFGLIPPQIDHTISTTLLQLNVYDTLISYDPEGFLAPALAESWETPDELSYVFHIREGVTFHDGAPLTAADVVFSFDRILDEETGATRRPEFARMASYEATDDFTVAVTMQEPYATFLSVLANRAATIVSSAFQGDYDREMNGTGPFTLESFEPDVQYVLVKNPDYWQPGMPYLDRVEVLAIPDDSARIAALRSGDVNFAEYIPSQFVAELDADPNFTVFSGYDIYNYIRINVNREPMTDPLVRQALNYAIDREVVIDLAFVGLGVPMTVGLIPPNDPVWYSQELDGHWSYDPDKALELLAEAGYDDPSELSFTLESSSEPNHLDSAQIIVEQWRAIGISAELQPLESAVRVDKRFSGDYTIMFDGAANPWTDPDFYSLYISSEGPVYAVGIGFSDDEIDRLLEEGRSVADVAARQAIYLELERRLLEVTPFVFINFRPQAEACAANVKGYVRVPGVGSASPQFMEWLWIDDEA
ncbi:MAG TPA: ABC transporter substrate-binding protein [Thermomicrobiales bacterium]|nr:ABC transporter substrate-binding protein [Thermomicrobiales bacterium]